MKNLVTAFTMICTLIISTANAQLNSANLQYGFIPAQKKMEKSYSHEYKNLKIYVIKAKPSLAKAVKGIENYINLETAMKKKMIVVKEVSVDGNVNSLIFKNVSKQTIMVQMGDVVQGGKQDRVVSVDALIKPGQSVKLSVFCVEHGRWTGGNQNNEATFDTYHSTINNSIKQKIVYTNNQSTVWQEVDKLNTANNTKTSTGTYTAVSSSATYTKDIQTYLNNLLSSLTSDSTIVGILAVTGDRIIGCEIFSTPQLFKTNAKNILNSYISEVVLEGKPITITDAAVNAYLQNLLSSEEQQNRVLQKNGKSLIQNGKKVKISAF